MNVPRGLLYLPLLASLALTGCGNVRAPAEPGNPSNEVGWAQQRLTAELGADQPPLLATHGDDALVVTVSEDGTLQSHLSTAGRPFEGGEPLETGAGYVMLGDVAPSPDGGWFALGSGGTVEVEGDVELTHDPVGFRSADGLVWEEVPVSGFAHPVEINDVAMLDDTLVVAGAYRTARDPSMGGFEAYVWTSTDGSRFAEVALPGVQPARGFRNESYAGHLAVTGDRLLAAGRDDRSATVWTSDDGARTWQQVADPVIADVYDISGLAVVGDVVVAGVGDGPVTAMRSTDQGETWAPVEALPAGNEEVGWAPVWADQGRFWTLTGIDDTSWSRPEVCYADLDQCGRDPAPQLVASDDGAEWTAVALPGEADTITGTADGRVLAVGVDGDGVVVHTLEAGATPPAASSVTEPKTVELVTLEEDEPAEVGVRYHAPMYVHCGMDWFWLGDATWRRTDGGPDVETGAGDDASHDWPLVGQVLYGYAELTDSNHLEYFYDDEVIATYRRADGAPGCA